MPEDNSGPSSLSISGGGLLGKQLPNQPQQTDNRGGLGVSPDLIKTSLGQRSSRQQDYTLPPLKDWKFSVDNDFVEFVFPTVTDQKSIMPSSDATSVLCERCVNLNFWQGGFAISDKIDALEDRATRCDFCRLLTICITSKDRENGEMQFERNENESVLVPTEKPYPVLSIFRVPGEL